MMTAETIAKRWAKMIGWYADKNRQLAETNERDTAIYQKAVIDARGMVEPQSSDELSQFSVRLVGRLSEDGIPTQDLLSEMRRIIDPEHCID